MGPLPGDDHRPGLFWPGAVRELPRVVRDLGIGRMLLLTGRGSFTASGAAEILPELQRIAEVEIWSDFSPNPAVDDLLVGAEILRAFEPDGIVAVGGGSVLDMAKLLATLGDASPADVPDAVRRNGVSTRSRKLVLVPTTSGSGSEATHFAVAYIGHEKFSVAHPTLIPDFVIIDPTLTTSASRYQKATSIIDAIAQAVESNWARSATDSSRGFAQAALTDLVTAAPAFLDGDSEAAVTAARGSHLAGRAIDLSKTTGAHALAYALTSRHGISHGHAVAITLGAFARMHAAAPATSGGDDARRDLETVARIIGADGPEQVGDQLDSVAADLGLELRLNALGVPRSDLAMLAASVNHERLANNPVVMSGDDIFDILESCW